MKSAWILLAIAAPLAAQQGFDFKSLDKLAAKAKESTNVTLEGQTLKLAASFLGGDKDSAPLKSIVSNLKGIYVRSFEFDKEGMYNPADIEPFRAWLTSAQWLKIADVKEPGETAEVFLKSGAADKLGGVAVISVEPLELTVVYIEGTISIDDVAKLSGNLDIPDLDVLKHGTGSGKASGNAKKEE